MPLLVQEGTDLSVAAIGNDNLLVHLAGRLWSLPSTGGDAVAITPAGELTRRPAVSPDGRTLAYESVRDGFVQVVLANTDGAGARQVTSGPWHHLSPAWSPDGRRLALASDRGGDFSIWELDADSLELRQLSFEPGDEFDPAWSPAGNLLAYVADKQGRSSLVVAQPSRPPRVLTTSLGPLRSPSWRPDGSVITYTAGLAQGPRLNMVILSEPPVVKTVAPGETAAPAPVYWLDRSRFLYAADGRVRRRAFGAPTADEVSFQANLEVHARIAPQARRLPEIGDTQPVRALAGLAPLGNGHVVVSALGNLWELGADGQLVRTLTENAYFEREPAASSDGRFVAFVSDRSGSAQIWTMNLATGETRQLSAESGEARHPAWDAAASRLAYLAGPQAGETGLTLKLLSLESGAVTALAGGLADTSAPAWSPDGLSIGVLQNSGGNPQLHLFAIDPPGARRRVTLPAATIGTEGGQLQFSPDGTTVLVASDSGVHLLPVEANGLVGAERRTLTDQPVHAARWMPGTATVWFADGEGLGRVGADEPLTRMGVDLHWRPARATGRTTIRTSRVFDGLTDGYLFDQDIVIEDSRIIAVEPWAAEPSGQLIDARGKTVLPGLIDVAVDLSGAGAGHSGRALLAYGVTTVQAIDHDGLRLRDLAERWRAQGSGPRVLQLGHWCGAQPATMPAEPVLVPGAAQLCPQADGAAATRASAAHNRDLTVWSADWRMVASGMVDAVNPADPRRQALGPALIGESGLFYQDAIDAIIHSGAAFLPGVGGRALPLLIEGQPDLLDSRQYLTLSRPEQREAQLRDWREKRALDVAGQAWLQARRRLASKVAAGGGTIATGSGAASGAWGLALHAEIRALAAAGLGPAMALQAATAASARVLGLQEEIGAVAAGRIADLLILDGDPLADLSGLLKIDTVILDGKLRPISELLDLHAPALEKFTPSGPPATAKPRRKRR